MDLELETTSGTTLSEKMKQLGANTFKSNSELFNKQRKRRKFQTQVFHQKKNSRKQKTWNSSELTKRKKFFSRNRTKTFSMAQKKPLFSHPLQVNSPMGCCHQKTEQKKEEILYGTTLTRILGKDGENSTCETNDTKNPNNSQIPPKKLSDDSFHSHESEKEEKIEIPIFFKLKMKKGFSMINQVEFKQAMGKFILKYWNHSDEECEYIDDIDVWKECFPKGKREGFSDYVRFRLVQNLIEEEADQVN